MSEQTAPDRPGKIAPAEEVLGMLTGIMRGEFPGEEGEMPRLADRFRAAELLARHYGLLQPPDPKERAGEERRQAAEAIEAVMAELTREAAGKEAEAEA